jgi:hypothetical protein
MWRMLNSQNLLAFFTAVLAIVTAFVGFLQWDVLRRTLDEMKEGFVVERAHVLNIKFDGYGSAPMAPGLTAKFWFNNFGKTPAILKIPPKAVCKYSVDGFHPLIFKAENPSLTDASGLLPEGFAIPVDKSFGPITSTLDATKEQIEQASTGVGKIYCEAIIGYSDVRDNLHETSVCFFL